MKLVSLPQPWASSLLFGRCDVINLPVRLRVERGDEVAIHASTRADHQYAGLHGRLRGGCAPLPLEERVGSIIGIVHARDCVPADGCQLTWARGPWCLVFVDPLVAVDPIEFPVPLGVSEIECKFLGRTDFIDPGEFCRRVERAEEDRSMDRAAALGERFD